MEDFKTIQISTLGASILQLSVLYDTLINLGHKLCRPQKHRFCSYNTVKDYYLYFSNNEEWSGDASYDPGKATYSVSEFLARYANKKDVESNVEFLINESYTIINDINEYQRIKVGEFVVIKTMTNELLIGKVESVNNTDVLVGGKFYNSNEIIRIENRKHFKNLSEIFNDYIDNGTQEGKDE